MMVLFCRERGELGEKIDYVVINCKENKLLIVCKFVGGLFKVGVESIDFVV